MTDIKNLHQVINLSQREAVILALETKLKGLLTVNAEANDKLVAALTAEAPAPTDEDCAREIWEDITDRRGLKWEANKVDDDVRDGEIFPAWAAIIARHRTQAATGWLPIEEHDGSGDIVLLWAHRCGLGPIAQVYKGFYLSNEHGGVFAVNSERATGWLATETEGDGYGGQENIQLVPTHYMPLPQEPKNGDSE